MSFTQTFGGTVIYPSDVSYRAVDLSVDTTLAWPTELGVDGNIVAQIMDVTSAATAPTLIMPPANQVSVGETTLIFNVGSNAFTVADNNNQTIVTISAGEAWQVWVTSNSTVGGAWRSLQYGTGVSSANAGALAGSGIKAIASTLNQATSVSTKSVNYSILDSDRSDVIVWTGGAGTLTLPNASTVGNDWFVHIRNSGTGAIFLTPSTGGQNINGGASLAFNPGDSAIIVCDGTDYYTIGFGQSAVFAFDYVSIDLTGQASPLSLTGANLNRIVYNFYGVLTGAMEIIVPTTIQQYWISNQTTGGYDITVKTLAGSGANISPGVRGIFYCNGVDFVDADTSGISLPLGVSDGGTGSTTASGARAALSAAQSGVNSDITELSGLTTPITTGQGGTGYTGPFTDGQVLIGNSVSGEFSLATLTAGANVTISNNPGSITISSGGGGGGGGTVTAVNVSGGASGFTFSGNPITTSGTITLDGGQLAIGYGGTGASTASGARTNMGLGSLAVLNTVNDSNWSGTPLAVANGGTGATTIAGALASLGALGVLASLLSGNGYVKLSNGLHLIWGTFAASANAYTTVTYPAGVSLTSFSRAVVSGANAAGNAQDNNPGVTSSSTTGFTVWSAVDSAITCQYLAMGV